MKRLDRDFFIVIPAFNEEGRIGKVVRDAKKTGFPVIVVDDGSKDKTPEEAKKGGAIVLRHKINLGKGASLRTGVEAAFAMGAVAIVALDADGQHNPVHIPKFIKALNGGNEIVFGTRQLSGKAPVVRLIGNKTGASLVYLLFGINRKDLLCGYLAFTKKAYKKIKWESARYGVETEIVARAGKNKLKYTEITIDTIYIDKYKGVSIVDALTILPSVFKWKLVN
jgi:glycosyltransferase involved in cell wall biosynthesis